MSYKRRFVLTTINVWGPHILVVPVTFSKHMIIPHVAGHRHIHPAHIFFIVLSEAIVEWGRHWLAPLLWRPRGLPVPAEYLDDWHVTTELTHGLETDIICKETILISGC